MPTGPGEGTASPTLVHGPSDGRAFAHPGADRGSSREPRRSCRDVHPSAKGRRNTVRDARRLLDLTQAELAEQVGVSRQTIVAVENGGYAPSVYLALALGDVLGASVESLLGPPETDTPERADVGRTPS